MGAPFMDYILVDDFVVPGDQQPFFTERLVHLPWCYQVNDGRREISPQTPSRAACGLPEKGAVFCSFNNSYKITPEMFDVWMELLKAVPESVLWLLEGNRFAPANLRREAGARGVAVERLVFAPRMPLPEHLARHRVADLFLDTFPVNAHTTASDALWAGCPVLTMAGETFVSRVAGSLLRTIGLSELVTRSLDEYRALALRLAGDADLLGRLRAHLEANRDTSRLFDASRFARSIEEAYLTMREIYASGRQPRSFHRERRELKTRPRARNPVALHDCGDEAPLLLRKVGSRKMGTGSVASTGVLLRMRSPATVPVPFATPSGHGLLRRPYRGSAVGLRGQAGADQADLGRRPGRQFLGRLGLLGRDADQESSAHAGGHAPREPRGASASGRSASWSREAGRQGRFATQCPETRPLGNHVIAQDS